MLDSSKLKQQHSETIVKIFDEFLQKKHTLTDYKLMYETFSNNEIPDINIDNLDVDKNNHGDMWDDNIDSQFDQDSKDLLNSPDRTNTPKVDLVHMTEEQKASSPKSSIIMSRVGLQVNDSNSTIQYFDEINYKY